MKFECSVASEQESDAGRRIHTTPPSLKLGAVTSFETVMPIHQTTQCHIPEQNMTSIFTVIKISTNDLLARSLGNKTVGLTSFTGTRSLYRMPSTF
jgi:hypothetical protein